MVNRPFLEYQVALLKKHGINDIVFATNYMAEQIQSHFNDGARFGVRMRYAVEESPLGTGGAIRNAADLFPGESVAVFNGDVLTDYDLGAVLKFHAAKKAIATITLQPIPAPNPFGVLSLDADNKVISWVEPTEEAKKKLAHQQDVEHTGTDLINAGFYVFDSKFIEAIPWGQRCSIERDIFPQMLAEGAPIYGIAPGGFWMDLGHAEQLVAAARAILDGSVKTYTEDVAVASRDRVADDVLIEGSSSIGKGVSIGRGSRLFDCIIMDNVTIGANVVLSHLIIDENCTVEDDVVLKGLPGGTTPVIAAGSVLRQGSRMHVT